VKIAVVGGTGLLGHQVAKTLRDRGHAVRVLSRRSEDGGVDLISGAGLAEALRGQDVVVNASNDNSANAAAVLCDGTRRLAEIGKTAGVGHHVCVSIVGCEKVPLSYFKIKAEQEEIVRKSDLPWTIVRATQFHEFIGKTLSSFTVCGLLPLPRAKLQPVASIEVAQLVADTSESPGRRDRIQITGPEIADIRDLARQWRARTGRGPLIVPIPLLGAAARSLRVGALTEGRPDVMGKMSFDHYAALA
jgi:uncharacterized protein YbjT (DUF2867 family)